LALKVERTPGRRTIARILIWAAKDRDDCVEPLAIEIESDGACIRFNPANPDVPIGTRAGRPSKGEQACTLILTALADGTWHRWVDVLRSAGGAVGTSALDRARNALVNSDRVEKRGRGPATEVRLRPE
jgi:hypothetical protein